MSFEALSMNHTSYSSLLMHIWGNAGCSDSNLAPFHAEQPSSVQDGPLMRISVCDRASGSQFFLEPLSESRHQGSETRQHNILMHQQMELVLYLVREDCKICLQVIKASLVTLVWYLNPSHPSPLRLWILNIFCINHPSSLEARASHWISGRFSRVDLTLGMASSHYHKTCPGSNFSLRPTASYYDYLYQWYTISGLTEMRGASWIMLPLTICPSWI